jgi:hypothetical protein
MTCFDVCDGDFLHQATFIHRDVYEKYGYYDETYKIAGDTAFFIKIVGLCNVSFRVVDIPISVFAGGGIASSDDIKLIETRHKEFHRIEEEILGPKLTKLWKEDAKKVRLYDKLHAHSWSWHVTMVTKHLCDLFMGKENDKNIKTI